MLEIYFEIHGKATLRFKRLFRFNVVQEEVIYKDLVQPSRLSDRVVVHRGNVKLLKSFKTLVEYFSQPATRGVHEHLFRFLFHRFRDVLPFNFFQSYVRKTDFLVHMQWSMCAKFITKQDINDRSENNNENNNRRMS